ncbi:MAG: imidazole glycerol phosphate synthase subunit HisH [Alphaproteobacteria bacterium TMED62]|nr:MAG: imidazole glycerol phosphate synthase subunit HisH [Alphaproteobacteria bacterium TMED62]|tara:strand:+ start:2279 stop:2908 length:630 start_codon:yes stop_codon:yes gene_type:complete
MITVVDYGYGNIFSIVSAFNEIGFKCKVSDKENDILNATIIVLPGVGAFKQAMRSLEIKKLDKIIIKAVANKKNIIGICLGYQMLFDKSNEFGVYNGLGLVEGEVRSLKTFDGRYSKIPNVGWRPLILNKENKIMSDKNDNQMFYFVHSFVPFAKYEKKISSFIKFNDNKIHASIHYNNIVGFQFHPEKSGKAGLKLLKESTEYLLNRD